MLYPDTPSTTVVSIEEPTPQSYYTLLKILSENTKYNSFQSNLWAITHLSWKTILNTLEKYFIFRARILFLLYFIFPLNQIITILSLVSGFWVFFLLKPWKILFCEYFTHEKTYFYILPITKNPDSRQLLWGMAVHTFALMGQCFMECPLTLFK